jgi:S1-C subfamily serine protease
MEDLNKNQIVLLTLLVSFVTSIATGIMTTSLLQEAPLEVTRNINRIVEKTIETVVPSSPSTNTPKEVTTVVVKEEDQVIDSINKNIKSIVRIKEKDGVTGEITFYGIGLVINKDGYIVADRKEIPSTDLYVATMNDGRDFPLSPLGVDKQTNFILFKANLPEKPEKTPYVFIPAALSDKDPQLGQTIISLGGDISNAISVGRVISFQIKETGTGTTTTKYLAGIDTDVSGKDVVDGSPVFNLGGDVVGLKLALDATKSFTPTSVLKKELPSLLESIKTQ